MTVHYAYNTTRLGSAPAANTITEAYGSFDDTYELYADRWLKQIHAYGGGGDDVINLHFEGQAHQSVSLNIVATPKGVSHGHHVFGHAELVDGGVGDNDYVYSDKGDDSDTYNFSQLNRVKTDGVIVGRIDDFDYSRDVIQIEGTNVDLKTIPSSGLTIAGTISPQ